MPVKSDLPFGSEFSPDQIDLPRLLELAVEVGGDWRAFERAVKDAYFSRHETSAENQAKLANNTRLSMIAYGIIDRDARLTEFGERLYARRQDDDALHAELARHILLHLNGAILVQCIEDMSAAGERIDLVTLRKWLQERGVHVPRGGKHPSIMRLWLERAGVFTHGWQVDAAAFQKLLGSTVADVGVLSDLTTEQRAFLRALINLEGSGPSASNEIERLASATYGVTFNEKMLPKQVLYPLRDRGFIALERGTRSAGRGAKPFLVASTEKLIAEVATPLLEQVEGRLSEGLRTLRRQSLATILSEIKSNDRHVRGLALEALALKLMRLVDLEYVATRLRGDATGGAEVDLLFESSRLVFSRWQVQCKNTASVALDDVAKEVGLTHLLKSNVIVMVSTGAIGPEARRYANRVMADSNLAIVTVDRSDMAKIVDHPAAILDVFNREARHAMDVKKLDLG